MSVALTLVLPAGVDSPPLTSETRRFGVAEYKLFPSWQLPDSSSPYRFEDFHEITEGRQAYEFGATHQLIEFCSRELGIWLTGQYEPEVQRSVCRADTLRQLVDELARQEFDEQWRQAYPGLEPGDLADFARLVESYAELGAYMISDLM